MTRARHPNRKTIKTLLVCVLTCTLFNVAAQSKDAMTGRIRSMDKEKDPEKNITSMVDIIREFKLDTIENAFILIRTHKKRRR